MPERQAWLGRQASPERQQGQRQGPECRFSWRTRVLLDANFAADGLLVAEREGGLCGFVLSIARQVPLFLQGLEPELAWITAFGVLPGLEAGPRSP